MRGVYALLATITTAILLMGLGVWFCSSNLGALSGFPEENPYETSAPMLLEDFRENAAALEARIGHRTVRVHGQVQEVYLDSEPTPVIWLGTGDVVLPAEMALLVRQPRAYQVKVGDKVWLQCEAVDFDAEIVTGNDCVLE
ncbi:hypothetical protein MF265_21575 [Serratia marcescens]|uniref:hypothetical protein n=1 Tax=Serratia marcescens TaxID=615 RepID=UPI001EEFE51A|nr:hypothetical protein [Serratia marcescens]ULH10485.1 hypothetical protein MF265_21575 [Serratia marcescens]